MRPLAGGDHGFCLRIIHLANCIGENARSVDHRLRPNGMFFSCFRIPDDRPGDQPILLDQRCYLRIVDRGAAEIEDGLRQIDRQA